MTRISLKKDGELDAGAAALFAGMVQRGGEVPDLYRLLANAPELLQAWTNLAWPLRNLDYVGRGLRELLIMRTAQILRADYEWQHHWRLAIAAGVSEAQLEALKDWRGAACFSEPERAALAMTDELAAQGHVSAEVFETLRGEFDEAQLVHLVLTVSFYVCVARVAHAFELDVEPHFRDVPVFHARD